MSFGERLKGELEYRGMRVRELSGATGIPKKTLDNYLLSKGAKPSADNAVSIARALGVTAEYLVTGRRAKAAWPDLSPEMRSIADKVELLSYENRKIVEKTVSELAALLRQPLDEEPAALTALQKVFLRLFR
ncbi:MAG: helix-turn-helix domain-containing protein [Treponema sp.]|nr:helix-turn-helix domain-containing protein [Treponema sp.]